VAVSTGTFTRNEVRRLENRNALDGLDDPIDPAHLTGKESVGSSAPTDEDTPPAKPPRRPRAPAEDEDGDEQARAVMVGAAARLLRKECKAVLAAGVKSAQDGDRFAALVTEFYTKHAALVADTLLMSPAAAEAYCAGQAAQAIGLGVQAVEVWDTDVYAAGLAALAMERGAA